MEPLIYRIIFTNEIEKIRGDLSKFLSRHCFKEEWSLDEGWSPIIQGFILLTELRHAPAVKTGAGCEGCFKTKPYLLTKQGADLCFIMVILWEGKFPMEAEIKKPSRKPGKKRIFFILCAFIIAFVVLYFSWNTWSRRGSEKAAGIYIVTGGESYLTIERGMWRSLEIGQGRFR